MFDEKEEKKKRYLIRIYSSCHLSMRIRYNKTLHGSFLKKKIVVLQLHVYIYIEIT